MIPPTVFLKRRRRTNDFYPGKTTPVVVFATRIARGSRGGLIEPESFHSNLSPLTVSNFVGENAMSKSLFVRPIKFNFFSPIEVRVMQITHSLV